MMSSLRKVCSHLLLSQDADIKNGEMSYISFFLHYILCYIAAHSRFSLIYFGLIEVRESVILTELHNSPEIPIRAINPAHQARMALPLHAQFKIKILF